MNMTILTSVFSRKKLRILFPILVSGLILSGCGSTRYRADYNGFNAAYADSSNHQMLLNLARLDQHDPTYFLQFGQISVQYQLSSSLNGVVNNTVPQSTFHIPFVTETGTIAAGATTTPQFTFIPVTDDKVAQQLLLPLPPEDLYTLFQQGLPIDQLLRLMAERFEIRLPNEQTVTTYSNAPGRCENRSYIVFLKICAIARELQMAGHLKLRTSSQDVPVAEDWTWSATPEKPSKEKGDDAASSTPEKTPDEPSPKDILDAHDKGLIYKKDPVKNTWSLYKHEETASFYLDEDSQKTFDRLEKDPVYGEGSTLKNIQTVLMSREGFTIQGNLVDTQTPSSRLILRSFLSVLAAAAQEQTDFETALCEPVDRKHVPSLELRPILKLKWDHPEVKLLPPLLTLDYHGQAYQITDPASERVDEAATWNRDVFRLLTELAGQASVDTSKFPLPTSLQVLPSP
jgi:hypothetical protein